MFDESVLEKVCVTKEIELVIVCVRYMSNQTTQLKVDDDIWSWHMHSW